MTAHTITMLQSEYDAIVREKRLKVLLIILTTIVVALVLYAVIKVGKEYIYQPTETMTGVAVPSEEDTDTLPASFPEPTKTDFADRFPTDFPSDIPVEKDVKLVQSQIIEYPGIKQLSIVFSSEKTVQENYDLYADFLKQSNWIIHNDPGLENMGIKALSATKGDMSITVILFIDSEVSADVPESPEPTKSRVRISILKP